MFRLLAILLLCLASLGLAQPWYESNKQEGTLTPYEQKELLRIDRKIIENRTTLAEAFKANDEAKIELLLDILKKGLYPELALTEIERLQIKILRGQYEDAIKDWSRLLKVHEGVDTIPFHLRCEDRDLCYEDTLSNYLKEKVNLEDSLTIMNILQKISDQPLPPDLKDIALLIMEIAKSPYGHRASIRKRATIYDTDSEGNHHAVFYSVMPLAYYGAYVDYRKDATPIQKIIGLCEDFERNHPSSPLLPLVQERKRDYQKSLEKRAKWADPTPRKVYTGGLGVEVFGLMGLGFYGRALILAFPLQYHRFIVTPRIGFQEYRNNVPDHVEFYPELPNILSLGYDLLDTKRFKVQPFLSVGGGVGLGTQADFRFWLETGTDQKLDLQAYLSLKVNYEIKWIPDRGFYNTLAIGIGGHIW